jgi:hypothetical protein
VDQELEIVPNVVVLLFVQLEAVLLAIEQCSVESADEAQRVLVLLDLLPLLSE